MQSVSRTDEESLGGRLICTFYDCNEKFLQIDPDSHWSIVTPSDAADWSKCDDALKPFIFFHMLATAQACGPPVKEVHRVCALSTSTQRIIVQSRIRNVARRRGGRSAEAVFQVMCNDCKFKRALLKVESVPTTPRSRQTHPHFRWHA